MTPEHAETARVLRAALARHSRLSGVVVRDEDRLGGELGLDSFALLNALVDVEDELGVEVDPSRLVDVRDMTFRQLVALLAETRAAHASSPGGPARPSRSEGDA